MLNQYSKFQCFMFKSFKDIIPFIYHFSPELVPCITSLAQAVMSQAESKEPLNRGSIMLMPVYLFETNGFMIN